MRELWIQGMAIAAAMRMSTRKLIALGLFIGLIVGLSGGLYFGWIVWPVGYAGEVSVSQAIYVDLVADLFAYTLDQERARKAMDWDGAAAVTCTMMTQATDEGQRIRLWTLLLVMDEGCE